MNDVVENWKPIDGYEEYQISDIGNVYNTRTNSLMAMSKTQQGDLKVTMSKEGKRVTRSIRVLVAEAFVYNPSPVYDNFTAAFDTVIVLNGNKNQINSDNLAWRPAWFAQLYAMQFHKKLSETYYTFPVMNVNTNIIYGSIIECGIREGLLFDDIHTSIISGAMVFPSNSIYTWG